MQSCMTLEDLRLLVAGGSLKAADVTLSSQTFVC